MERELCLSDRSESVQSDPPNRVALLTPPGAAAIAVIRLSGPLVPAFLQNHFSRPITGGRCVHGLLRDDQMVIDDPVIVSTSNGLVADINLHGGEWVVRACIELAQRHGFDRVDLLPDQTIGKLQEEILTALPSARTELAIRMLLRQEQLWNQVKPDADLIEEILADTSLWWLLHPPKVAIVGAANVGKSTLANQLFGEQRSITADVPGTTRDWVGDWTSIDGLPILLIDTPGLRESDDAIEQAAITLSAGEISGADLVIVLLDPTRPLAAQRVILDRYPNAIVVVNKADLPATWQNPIDAVSTIAITGEGIARLQRRIRERFISNDPADLPNYWTVRQQQILQRAIKDPSAWTELFTDQR